MPERLQSAVAEDAAVAESFRLGYRPALDGVRAVAILMVMWHHSFVVLMPWSRGRWSGGFTGVDVFFVLSGFLITTVVLERKQAGRFTYAGFYQRRAQRLLPALFVFLAAHAVISSALHDDMWAELRAIAAAATYTSNLAFLANLKLAGSLVHLWSLAVEEQFYLVWPTVLLLLLHRRVRTMFLVLLAAVAAIGLWRFVWMRHYGQAFPVMYFRTEAHADGLLVGAMLSLALHFGWRPPAWLRRWAGGAALVVLVATVYLGLTTVFGPASAPFLSTDRVLYDGGFTLVALAGGGLILAGLDGPGLLHRTLARRPLVAIGRASYSLYLWHTIVFLVASQLFEGAPARIAVAWPAAWCAAWLSRRYVEEPFLGLRTRDRSSAPTAPERPTRTVWAMACGALVVLCTVGGLVATLAHHQHVARVAG
jgi:peptidoglycan/LPS O-acetylase OafA/YrhL